MKYKIAEWEDNGYHDSDFYGAYYDSDTGEVVTVMIGTTRGIMERPADWAEAVSPDAEAIEGAREWLEGKIKDRLPKADEKAVSEPSVAALEEGVRIRTLAKHRNKEKETEPCNKCSGTGNWVNPRNSADKRMCFACKGSGVHKTRNFKKDENGKTVFTEIPAGSCGTIMSAKAYGTFYKNGYNRPNRDNVNLVVRLDDGRFVNIPAKKAGLEQNALTEAEIAEKAENLSHNLQFEKVVGCKGWLSVDYASGFRS